ncbi:unnamed protein product [Mycena citricolor]|uniref:CCHC-type domain-containing protein n=1 Tax=Mycena citricolor TaxID=2018698 RepID=A0AAD2Q531_9AGAR|nr:unnamed protein product [Mycena citricolor]
MILKPIPPKEYDGSPNAVAFHRFVKEGTAYLKLGRVPADEQTFYLLYFMSGRAREFYNSRVENDEHTWTLSDFFWGLFNFCFPVNFREKQRSKLNVCKQDDKSVLVHKAKWEQIFNTIGLEANQEKVVMFCRSLKTSICKEMFRANLDPEMSTWDEVTRRAEAAEVIVNIDLEDADSDVAEAPRHQPKWKKDILATENEKRRNGGQAFSVSSAAVKTPKKDQNEKAWDYVMRDGKKLPAKTRATYLSEGRCFECGERGQLSRNCPDMSAMKSEKPGKPPGIASHAIKISLAETTETVKESFDDE